jgi:GTP pyrophosphokinase
MDSLDDLYGNLIASVQYLSSAEAANVQRAFERARLAHGGARRKSGEPYITHPLAVAQMLAAMRMDPASLQAALLHDVLEDTAVAQADLEQEFDVDVTNLVKGLTKLDGSKVKTWYGSTPTYAQIDQASLVSLFMATAQDLRVIVIKLCDRLHNMLTIDALKPERRLGIATETLELFAPVAARLGLWQIKKQLEDLSLRVTDYDTFAEIQEMLQARSQLLRQDLQDTLPYLKDRLAGDGISAEVEELPEHIYGIYRHVKAHGWDSARAYDGLRACVIVNTQFECYAALGSVHSLWQPLPGRVIDFIAVPKDGLYRSLHTVVIGLRGHPLEVRIRTPEMHHLSNYGIVAFLQRPASDAPALPKPSLGLLSELRDLPGNDPEAFLEWFKSQITPAHIRTFTPQGDIIELPAKSTPVDFAYAVHSEIGHTCHSALVNQRFVPLNSWLHDGDQVEIGRADTPRPDRAWLDEDLGYTHNASTLKHIRRWFAHLPENDLLEQGRALIEKEICCWAPGPQDALDTLARRRGMTVQSLCLRIGRGEISVSDAAVFVLRELAGWKDEQAALVTLEITATDRPGLLLDACRIIADDNVNMRGVSAAASDDNGLARVCLSLEVKKSLQAVRIVHRLERMLSVIQVRCTELVTGFQSSGSLPNR